MINLERSSFFLPTKKFRELSILLAILRESHSSQQDIAGKAGLSGAMVNGYVKELKSRELIDVVDKNRRDKVYRITEPGRKKLMNSLMHCSAEIVQLYGQARQEIIVKLRDYFNGDGTLRLVLFGGADTAQLVNSALEQFPQVIIVAVVDNNPLKWGRKIGNHVIQSPDVIKQAEIDCIVISSFARQDEIYESIKTLEIRNIQIIRLASL